MAPSKPLYYKKLITFFAIILCLIPLNITIAEAKATPGGKTVGVAFSMGAPDLINFQAHFFRVGWLRFGYGLGTQPVKQIVNKFAKINPGDFVYSVNDDYEVYPTVDFGLRSFNSFVRIFPFTESFYFESKYTLWKIDASVQAFLRNKHTQTSISVGTVGFRVLQPMFGGGLGYEAIWDSGLFLDIGLGAQYLFTPNATYWIGGLVGSGLQSSIIAPEIHAQVEAAQDTLNQEIDKAVRTMRKTVTVIPTIYFTIGWAF